MGLHRIGERKQGYHRIIRKLGPVKPEVDMEVS
jgi:hypothetical protein